MRLTTYDCDVCGDACTYTTEGEDVPVMCPCGRVPMWEVRHG